MFTQIKLPVRNRVAVQLQAVPEYWLDNFNKYNKLQNSNKDVAKYSDFIENFAEVDRLLLSQLAHFKNLQENCIDVPERDDDK